MKKLVNESSEYIYDEKVRAQSKSVEERIQFFIRQHKFVINRSLTTFDDIFYKAFNRVIL